ncbi:helix-turn-helix transcriptional regulator [uncultured Campylobacter sp.]|uniref:heat shock protein transcriptional repressor HspR n=1 Tax=uncultured Campylobacter sp. TaxID=218934 RepID=UPI002630186D|nr:helix-turn-helix transcriptional regulator [uncultured Campylobacter sp.]
MSKYDEPLYLISVVAKMLDIHPQTLRQYEREGLIEPDRTDGKVRLYSQRDLDKISSILNLTRHMGVNLAGVDVIFKLKEQMIEYENIIDELNKELEELRGESSKKRALVKKSKFNVVFYEEKK